MPDTAVATWRDVDAALCPIIGQGGVAALFKRSLYLTRVDYPWLLAVYDGAVPPDEFTALYTALSQQPSATAAAANGALEQTFYDQLANLIGGSLTERLLGSILDNASSSRTTQDTSA